MKEKDEGSDIDKLREPLKVSDIEFRIGSVSKNKGFSLIAYKTARTDVKRLNEVFGLNWSNEYFYDSKGLLCSKISVFSNDKWFSRIDVGTESNTEKEKGSYSDAFKRAGFKFGIGAELYDFPFVWINWNDWSEYNGKVTPKFQINNLQIVDYLCEFGEIKRLILSYKGKVVYSLDNSKKKPAPSKATVDDKKQAWSEFSTICTTMNVDASEFMESNLDMSDRNAVYAEVRKWLQNEQMLRDQLLVFKNS